MPLEHGKSKKAFSHNVEAEMHAGKPMKQSLAIAYAVKRRAKKYAGGGEVHSEHMAEEMPHEDLVGRVMQKRMGANCYSEGGQVANDDHAFEYEFHEPDNFDDLVRRGDMEFHETGENSGDHIGDAAEDHDRHDIVAKVMRSRKKKDHNPRPA